MSTIFHRDNILRDPAKAWQRYKNNPDYFEFPERITIEVTNRCNLECFMCPRNNVNMKLGDMDTKLFCKIIDEAAKFLPVCIVPFFRGESLLHPKFLEMVSYAKRKGVVPIQLATNGYFLSPKLSRGILDLKLDFISFSVDANQPELYQKMRKNSDFKRVFSNILYFLDEKKKRELILPRVQISAVKTKDNESFIKDFINFWQDKVDRVRVYHVHSLSGKLGSLEGDQAQNKRKPCLKPLTDMVIYWNGDVALCNHDWQRRQIIGNVRKESIIKIWKNSFYEEIRKKHLELDLKDFSPCDGCSHWRAYYEEDYIIGEAYEKNRISPN